MKSSSRQSAAHPEVLRVSVLVLHHELLLRTIFPVSTSCQLPQQQLLHGSSLGRVKHMLPRSPVYSEPGGGFPAHPEPCASATGDNR